MDAINEAAALAEVRENPALPRVLIIGDSICPGAKSPSRPRKEPDLQTLLSTPTPLR